MTQHILHLEENMSFFWGDKNCLVIFPAATFIIAFHENNTKGKICLGIYVIQLMNLLLGILNRLE